MADSNNTGDKPDESVTPKAEAAPVQAAPPAGPQVGTGGRGLSIAALLVALVAAAGTVFVWYRTNVEQRLEQGMAVANISGDLKGVAQKLQILEDEQTKLAAAVDAGQGKIQGQLDHLAERQNALDASVAASISTNISKSVAPIEATQAELTKSMANLTQSVEKLYADLDRSLDSWALEEVEQLLRIANHSAALAEDPIAAMKALEYADRRLEALGNPKLLQVRSQVAEEIALLKSVEPADLEGTALRLANMAKTVDKLPLADQPKRTLGPAESSGETQADAAEDNAWLEAGREFMTDLKSMVRIQTISAPPKPLLAPEQRYFLHENLRLALSGAQLAVLKEDAPTYRANIDNARQWLGDYFDPSAEVVKQMAADLDELKGVNISPQIPDITGSLAALKKIKAGMTGQ